VDKSSEKKPNTVDKEEVLKTALKRFRLAEEADIEQRKLEQEDVEFRAGKQWSDADLMQRRSERRPALVINRIPQFIRQVSNEQRQNPSEIKVSPVDDKADIQTAKILQGMIRHIEYDSSADIAYATATDSAATKGRGYFRVITDYESCDSFNLVAKIKRIRNSGSVFLDPHHKEPDGSDASWGFVFEDMSLDDFKAQYPKAKLNSMDSYETTGNQTPGWFSKDSCRVAEYFFKEYTNDTLLKLRDGSDILLSEAKQEIPEELILNKRQTTKVKIKWLKINGVEILEETYFPGEFIPIIPVYGDEIVMDGKVIFEGVVRHAKDSQKMYNYWASAETEMIALAPKAPFIGVEGQFEGHERAWKTANVVNHAFLQYKPISVDGKLAPPPQRNAFEAPVAAITNARMNAAEDLKATTGMYDAAMGNHSNETSGIAISRRVAQSQTTNFHFIDNLRKSQRHCGRILISIIPKVYDTARTVAILGEDGTKEIVQINQIFEKDGKESQYDLSKGKYDVTIDNGPSFMTRRQEAVASIIDFIKVYPAAAQIVGDLLAKNMDWPGAQEISERLKKMVPPELQDQNSDQAQMQMSPQIQGQMQQMSQMIEALTAQLNDANEKIKTKSMEIESRERIEMAKLKADISKKAAELDSREAIEILYHEMEQLKQRLSFVDFNEPFDEETNGAGSIEAMAPQQNQSTGGFTPGLHMEENP